MPSMRSLDEVLWEATGAQRSEFAPLCSSEMAAIDRGEAAKTVDVVTWRWERGREREMYHGAKGRQLQRLSE